MVLEVAHEQCENISEASCSSNKLEEDANTLRRNIVDNLNMLIRKVECHECWSHLDRFALDSVLSYLTMREGS